MKKILLLISAIFAINLMAANDGTGLFKKCAGCHGLHAEKKALGKSQVIADWKEKNIVDALNGYKDGTFGGAMKGIMKAQVASYSEEQIKTVAKYISELKK